MKLPCPKQWLLAMLLLPVSLLAQKKDTLRLKCLLDNPVVAPDEKPGINVGAAELKIVLSSATDTLVKACTDAVISVVQRDEEGKLEIVFFHKYYWFWLSGLSKAVVRKDQKVKTGEVIGHLKPGDKIELLLYDFETPIDPKKYMKCGE
jgi:hypothetical protein